MSNQETMRTTSGLADAPPGTITLTEYESAAQQRKIILHPKPSADPNDPLNWSARRKWVNYGITSYYVLMTFVVLDIFGVSFQPYMNMGLTYDDLNNSWAAGYAGLAVGCYLFIPLLYKFGRRPIYIFSVLVQFACSIWAANATTAASIICFNLVSGLGGAIAETIVQISIADLFFVHQRGTTNGIFMGMQTIGSFVGPIIAGYIIEGQGWRWMWWWTAIFLAVEIFLMVFCQEETKYTPVLVGQSSDQVEDVNEHTPGKDSSAKAQDAQTQADGGIDTSIPMKTMRERYALWSVTPAPIWRHYYQPVILLFSIPAVAFTAITYGTILAWISVMGSTQSLYLLYPPYNFGPSTVGLFGIPYLIGVLLGTAVGGPLNDKIAIWLARRNGGIFEPEFRLWAGIPAIILCPLGLIIFGCSFVYLWPWPVIAVSSAIFGAGFVLVADVSLTYLTDSYHDVVGDALVAVAFVRNILSVIVLFTLTPWLEGMGLLNLYICITCLCFGFLILIIPMLIWGKTFRAKSAAIYKKYALRQPSHRAAFEH